MSVGVVSGDDLVYAEGFGFADIESRRPQAPEVPQRIGSITKTFTGLCTMALVEEGRLSLDDRVVELLPDITFHGPAETLNVWHILTHTGGIGEAPTQGQRRRSIHTAVVGRARDPADLQGVPRWNRDRGHPRHQVVLLEPRDWTSGRDRRTCRGQPHRGGHEESRVRPAGNGRYGLATTSLIRAWAPGTFMPRGTTHLDLLELTDEDRVEYETVDGHNINGPYVYVTPRACGAIQSTIPDMARYASALLRKGAGIVKPETFDAMVAPQYCPDDRMISLGFTFQRIPRFGRRSFGHGGGGGRMYWNAYLSVVPEEDLAVLIHMNFTSDLLNTIASRMIQAALNAPDEAFSDSPPAPEILAAAPGVYQVLPGPLTNYRPVTTAGRVQITARDGRLFLRSRRGAWRDGLRMLPADPADPAFFALDSGATEPPMVALVLEDNGCVKGIRFDRLVYMERNESLDPWA